ncbi:MAG: AI-2E family transporter [Clostridiales bacterium]|nr:AI-2E family transporter [Clostridiales bacterium]
MNESERYTRDKAAVMSMIKFILIVLIFCAIAFCATKIVVVLVPFLIGFLLAKTSFAIAGLFVDKDMKKAAAKKRRKKIAIIVYVILLIIIAIALIWCCFSLVGQIMRAVDSLTRLANEFDIQEWGNALVEKVSSIDTRFMTQGMKDSLENNLVSLWGNMVAKIPAVLSAVLAAIWGLIGNIPYGIFVVICVILSGYYFINDGSKVLRFYMKNVPNRQFRLKSISLINDLAVTLFRALGGYLLLLIITTVEAWAAFRLAGVDYAIILALITGLIDFLPVLGISATMVPVMIYCGVKGDYTAVAILIVAMTLMTIIRRVIEPPILGKTLQIHPLLMLLGMAAGVYIWGAVGFLLGPVVLIIIIDIMHVFELDKKIMNFLSRVLGGFMKTEKKGKLAAR